MDRLTLYGSFTSSSSYKPMLYLALARLPFSFRTVNLKTGVQKTPEYLAVNRWGVVPSLRHRCDSTTKTVTDRYCPQRD